jgi:16S rRNA (guanine527-N7)-methyltransferase
VGNIVSVSRFVELLERWNRSINLTAARTRAEIEEHVEDSQHVVECLRDAGAVLDVGSGGGFPVIVAALSLPNCLFVALEPIHKKHAFLRTVVRELSIANVDVRAERLDQHARHDYDVAMSRATFELTEWFELGARYVRPGGRIIGFEASAVGSFSFEIERHAYRLGSKQRALVIRTK